MLYVKTPEEVLELIQSEFSTVAAAEEVALSAASGRILAEDIPATEYVHDFNRSTVDGYALRARDTFGCSESIPAILPLKGEVLMGEGAGFVLAEGECAAV
ncbi:MAG: molybdopterin molybdenumtransferase MoeA, partial [Clostridia bacterium]|nr:molybdopterin molybdenumtransferase MoeA [Clostridia bacterium]